MEMETLILGRIDAIDKKLDGLKSDVLQRVTELETQIAPLFDNGQPGRCNVQDARIRAIEDIEAERKGWIMSRKALVATAASILLMLGGMITAGANVYGNIHRQSEDIRTQIATYDDHARAHQAENDKRTSELQAEIDALHSVATSQRKNLAGDVRAVGDQVQNLSNDVNTPKKHWYK
jgi:hypothetical protein